MVGLDPVLRAVADRAIVLTKIDFGIAEHGGLRTADEQHDLFQAGLSQLDGYVKESYHQTGKALDVYAFVGGKASWEMEHMAQIAAAFLQAACEMGVKLEWGGLWKSFQDTPHFQLVEG